MHFSTTFALTLASLASAAPTLHARTNSTSCPDPNQPVDPTTNNIIRPSHTSQYDVWTGAVRYDSSKGKIFKDGRTTDITTLLTFDFPAASAGKQCSFHFDLSSDPSAIVIGSRKFDLFVSLAPATRSTSTWPNGNLRDHHIGRLTASKAGEAVYEAGQPLFGKSFPCPAGETYGAELVGVGDVDHVEWLVSSKAGPYVTF